MNIIEIKNLNKTFKEVKAVSDLSFKVKKGEFFAFLGVNGAGKSTTINMMCAQLEKDSGTILIDGLELEKNAADIKSKIGVVFQNSLLDRALSVRENLESRAALYGIVGKDFEKRLSSLATALDFPNLLSRTVGKLSGGQRRRIDVARALLHNPEILILDEPTTGLDPQTRKILWDVINGFRKDEGMTVFLTTHYMEEAAEADYVVILDSGKIAAEGTPLELKNKYTADTLTLYGITDEDVSTLGVDYVKNKDFFVIKIPSTSCATELIVKYPDVFRDYEIVKGKMDDVFIAVTGKKLEGGDK